MGCWRYWIFWRFGLLIGIKGRREKKERIKRKGGAGIEEIKKIWLCNNKEGKERGREGRLITWINVIRTTIRRYIIRNTWLLIGSCKIIINRIKNKVGCRILCW